MNGVELFHIINHSLMCLLKRTSKGVCPGKDLSEVCSIQRVSSISNFFRFFLWNNKQLVLASVAHHFITFRKSAIGFGSTTAWSIDHITIYNTFQ